MNHGSLFSGIGGFDLAAEWMGWTNVFHCEWEEFPRKVLNYHFPKSISYGDIKETDFTIHRGQIDILTGGFPCQPYSSAGKRLGKEDDRHLWPEMLRAIREIQPRWVVGENVRGLVNWNGGLVFEEVQADLENEGYEVQPFILPAAGVNAPHRRDRVWFVAYSNKCNDGRATSQNERTSGTERIQERNEVRQSVESSEVWRNAKNTDSNGCTRNKWKKESNEWGQRNACTRNNERLSTDNAKTKYATNSDSKLPQYRYNSRTSEGADLKENATKSFNEPRNWEEFPTQSPICGGNDGLPKELDSITFPKWRNESIKAYGNAIVPQVVYPIFKAIESYEDKN
jgi:DNA (cytosine-5)-methyltransferase 1